MIRKQKQTAFRPSSRLGRRFQQLVEVQARLRAPGGCPWDREQTHRSLRPYLLEEAYEVLEALDQGDDRKLASELGDLLLQVVFHAQIAGEQGRFDAGDVADAIRLKLIRRHPHVFGKGRARNSAEVLKRWEELKAEERRENGRPEVHSLLEGVPRNLPGLSEAFQLTRRASNVGFDWKSLAGVLRKLAEEILELRRAARSRDRDGRRLRAIELRSRRRASSGTNRRAQARIEEEAGDLLFAAANVARFLGLEPEIALKKANRKFLRRFRWMEQRAAKGGRRLAALSQDEMETLWNQAKLRKLN